jgi:hypothetical protein
MKDSFHYQPQEIDLLANGDLILRKNKLLDQVEMQLIKLGKESAKAFPELVEWSPPLKVSKGEKQEGLPFLVLDYPRVFNKKDVFAIRTMVWWGKFISTSLHLKGKYLDESKTVIESKLLDKKYRQLYIACEGNEWQHDLDRSPYQKVDEFQMEQLAKAKFLKLVFRLQVDSLNQLGEFQKKTFEESLSFTPYGAV